MLFKSLVSPTTFNYSKKEAKIYQVLKTYNVFYTPLTYFSFTKTTDKL